MGVGVVIIPGVSSLFGAAASLKVELTPKGVSESVIITRPAGRTLDKDYIRELSRFGFTMAIFLGASHLDEIRKSLECPPDTPAAIVFHATWEDEYCIRGTVSDIAEKAREAGIEKTALLIIGGAADPLRRGVIRSHLYS
jgi:precorrin-4/cobalt-precorrin-4 C11-methyltransferase